MIPSKPNWFNDLKYELFDFANSFIDFIKALLYLLYFLFIEPVVKLSRHVYKKTNNFYWLKIATKKHVYSWVKKNIVSGKAKSSENVRSVIEIFKKNKKLTIEQANYLEGLFLKLNGYNR